MKHKIKYNKNSIIEKKNYEYKLLGRSTLK